jgi:hypothetical protein
VRDGLLRPAQWNVDAGTPCARSASAGSISSSKGRAETPQEAEAHRDQGLEKGLRGLSADGREPGHAATAPVPSVWVRVPPSPCSSQSGPGPGRSRSLRSIPSDGFRLRECLIEAPWTVWRCSPIGRLHRVSARIVERAACRLTRGSPACATNRLCFLVFSRASGTCSSSASSAGFPSPTYQESDPPTVMPWRLFADGGHAPGHRLSLKWTPTPGCSWVNRVVARSSWRPTPRS